MFVHETVKIMKMGQTIYISDEHITLIVTQCSVLPIFQYYNYDDDCNNEWNVTKELRIQCCHSLI